jgi:phosphate transport system substrate-binding protein
MRKLFLLTLTTLISSVSSAADPATTKLKITSAGPGSMKAFERVRPEVEAATKTTIELSIYKQTVAIQSLMKGQIDGITLTNPEQLVAENSEDFKGIDTKELVWQPFCEGYVLFLTNKSNKVSDLKSEQIKDILTGKITNWKDVGGEDQAISIFTADSLIGTNKALAQSYLNQLKLPVASKVADQTGVARAVLNDKGAIGIGSGRLPKADFDINYIQSKAKLVFNLAVLKKGNPVMLKIIDILKQKPVLKDE